MSATYDQPGLQWYSDRYPQKQIDHNSVDRSDNFWELPISTLPVLVTLLFTRGCQRSRTVTRITVAYFAAGRSAEYCDRCVCVCLSVCLCACISKITCPKFTKLSIHVTCGCYVIYFRFCRWRYVVTLWSEWDRIEVETGSSTWQTGWNINVD